MNITRELETLFFIMIASVIGLFGVYYTRQVHQNQPMHIVTTIPSFVTFATPTPTPVVLPKPTNYSWNSSDGEAKINMTTTINADTTKTFTFATINTTTNTTTPLFTKTVVASSNMVIPFNAFSPDDNYVYISEIDGNVTHYFVFKTSGETFADGATYVDVTPLFVAYTAEYALSEVTGWADSSLLIVNTKTQDGKQGPSFWFDVSSKSFILLSNTFQ
jgi:hypothetical protein